MQCVLKWPATPRTAAPSGPWALMRLRPRLLRPQLHHRALVPLPKDEPHEPDGAVVVHLDLVGVEVAAQRGAAGVCARPRLPRWRATPAGSEQSEPSPNWKPPPSPCQRPCWERTHENSKRVEGQFQHRNILLLYPPFIPHLSSTEKSASPICQSGPV